MRYQVCPEGTWETASRRPHPRLRPGVICYRGHRLALPAPRRRLETPVGAVTLVLGFGSRLRITGPVAPPDWFDSCLAGLHTAASLGEHDGRLHGVEVLFTPWEAFRIFAVPLHELADRAVRPRDLLGRRLDDLAGALAALPGWAPRFALLDSVLARWSAGGPACAPQVVRAWDELCRTHGRLPIARLAADVGWSTRQLENRFREQIGLRPKAAARVLRLQHALRLLTAHRPPAQVAAACGYYDQAHLGGEIKAMTGRTPLEFVAQRDPATTPSPPGPPSLDRLAGAVTSVILPS
ncbi:Transcriptional regulator [Streptantibioticus cattleyicolor NRRL 8057 = DSM 46488]|nr:Transcriptional regulator [Streptantibioticus cattleyicolor NRRL 8057 = DSM 46488]